MRIREVRKSRGITQAQLGSRIGLPQCEISRIERGRRTLSVRRLCSIAEALEVHPAALLEAPPPRPGRAA
jgi:transcriptional regulator with XRE-family HTH domain